MKILIVDDDDALVAFLAKELEARGYEILQTHFGDGGLKLYNKYGPWEFVLSDFRFVPGTKIKDGVQLVTAIHGINPHQQMALMTADPKGATENLPQALRHLPVLRKHFRLEQLVRLLRQPVLPLTN
ncbi:MAG: response regulator [Candidatus Sulfotelmatobacter sp.]|jgi:DNA-binding NtrC family response regulator